MDVIQALWSEFHVQVIALLLTLPRIYAFLEASQLLNSSVVPRLPRAVAILSLATTAVPINLEYASDFTPSVSHLALYFAKELAIGFLAGYVIGLIFWVVQAAGGLIDNQRGAAIASSIDPLQGQESTPLGNLFSQAFLAYVFNVGAFLPVLGLLYKSYVLWPATQAIPALSAALPTRILGLFDDAMRLAFVLAAPIVAIMFIAEFSLAMISRFSPQIQVFILAMPIKSILAIIVLVFYGSELFPYAAQTLLSATATVEQLFQIMKAGN